MISTEEYDDAVRYDAEYGQIDDAATFFLSLAETCGRRVLDLENPWHSFVLPDGSIVDVSGTEVYDPATGIMRYRTFRTRRDIGLRTETALDIKFTGLNDLLGLLHECGLLEERIFGDFSGGPLIDASPEIVVVAGSDQPGQPATAV